MTEKEFKWDYSIAVKRSNNYTDIKPISMFLHALMTFDEEEAEESLYYMRKIERDLLDRDILPFKIEKYEDGHRIDMSDAIGFMQYCIWSVFKIVQSKKEDSEDTAR